MASASEDTPSASPAAVEEEAPPPGWGTDDRISFSKESGKYLQQNDDGSEMEWNSKLKAWMPVVGIFTTFVTYSSSKRMR